MTAKTPRWLDLVAYLLGHHFPVTREQIFGKVAGYGGNAESARRKFERDKDELRALGIEIETVPLAPDAGDSSQSGYRLKPASAYLHYFELVGEPAQAHPYPNVGRILLTRPELELLDRATRFLADQGETPLAEAAASARRKLAFDLPLEPAAMERVLALPLADHVRSAFTVLQDAMRRQVTVSCRYFTMSRATASNRVIEPWGLLFQLSHWYLVGRARDRDEPRLFRVDRMRDVKALTGQDATFTVPDDFDVRSFAGRFPWEFGDAPPRQATVRFAWPESRQVINRGLGRVVEDRDEDGATLAFELRDDEPFLRWLLAFGRRAEVLSPSSLADALVDLRADVAALYAERAP
jgi:predicted DNA-binding transcriptional regulator YafY